MQNICFIEKISFFLSVKKFMDFLHMKVLSVHFNAQSNIQQVQKY